MKKNLNLENKIFLVAGSTGYLGKSIVNELLEQNSQVIAIDLDDESIKKQIEKFSSNSNFLGLVGDITKLDSIEEVFKIMWNRMLHIVN